MLACHTTDLKSNNTRITHKLDGNHENSFQWELAITEVEQILKARTQQLQHQRIVLATRTEIVNLWHTICQTQKSYAMVSTTYKWSCKSQR